MAVHKLSILVSATGAGKAAKELKGVDAAISRIGARGGQGIRNLTANLAALGAAAAVGIGAAVAVGVRDLARIERINAQTEAVIASTGAAAGVTAAQVQALAAEFERTTTVEAETVQEAQNLLLTFTKIGESVFPSATKAVVDLAVGLAGGDVAAANFESSALQIGKALQDPVRGITALRRAGVAFTKEQEQQIKTLVESGKTIEAQTLILRELEVQFGKSGAAAGKGPEAALRRLGHVAGTLRETLATALLPSLTKLSDKLSTVMADPAVMRSVGEFGQILADAFDSAIAIAEQIPWKQVGQSLQVAGAGAKTLFEAFTNLPPWVQTAVLTGWGLNKLTGGALSGIAGELGKGLIKGVLGMNAGVVNLNAGVVRGGGIPGVSGAGGAPAGAAAAGGLLAPGLAPALAMAAAPLLMYHVIPKLIGSLPANGQGDAEPIKTPGGGTISGANAGMVRLFTPALKGIATNTKGTTDQLRISTAEQRRELGLAAQLLTAARANASSAAVTASQIRNGFSVTVPVTVNTTVSVRGINVAQRTYASYARPGQAARAS